MKILVTGAGGFIGQTLVRRLEARLATADAFQLLLVDRHLPVGGVGERIEGDLTEPDFVRALAERKPDRVFHLASMPGGQAEREPVQGRRVNLEATLNLFEALGQAPNPPVVVFASTVAVYGAEMPPRINEQSPLRPAITYGAHKLMGEIALADFTRRGLLDGRSLRLPGIVARSRETSGLASAFMSELFHAVAAGERYVCPVSREATAWWMSAACCVDNLLHAAEIPAAGLDSRRSWQLPVLHASVDEVVQALGRRFGADRCALISYQPQPALEAVFGSYPPLDAGAAWAIGMVSDGSLDALVARALNLPPGDEPHAEGRSTKPSVGVATAAEMAIQPGNPT